MKELISKAAALIKSDTARLDAELLLAHALGVPRVNLLFNASKEVNEKKYFELVQRRARGEPIAYILGYKDFWKDSFKVTPATLIPRPETELIIETALRYNPKSILDLGTGTGCIALSLLREFQDSKVTCVDISAEALEVAKSNAMNLGLANRCEFLESSWFENLENKKFDLIVSNPPYISATDELGIGVKEFEPHSALFAENNGLEAYQRIAEGALKHLNEEGVIIVEIGKGQESAVQKIFSNYELLSIEKDLGGINRVLAFRWMK